MQPEEYVKVKITGKPRLIRETLGRLSRMWIVTRTSNILHHPDDDLAHIYVLLIGSPNRREGDR